MGIADGQRKRIHKNQFENGEKMKTIIISDDRNDVLFFERYAAEMESIEIAGVFLEGMGAVSFLENHDAELAILDVQKKGINGVALGQLLRSVCPEIVLIYIMEDEEYSMEAAMLHAAAYLLKPFTKMEADYAVQTARLYFKRHRHKIFIKTFGYFDVFVDGTPIMFRSGKAKELLALLVDRQGGTVNTEQIICALWEDRPNDEATQNLCSKTAKTLKQELKEHGIEEILIVNRSMKRVNTDIFTCDLYELLKEEALAKKQFVGDYMLEYSWAEERMAGLSKYL